MYSRQCLCVNFRSCSLFSACHCKETPWGHTTAACLSSVLTTAMGHSPSCTVSGKQSWLQSSDRVTKLQRFAPTTDTNRKFIQWTQQHFPLYNAEVGPASSWKESMVAWHRIDCLHNNRTPGFHHTSRREKGYNVRAWQQAGIRHAGKSH